MRPHPRFLLALGALAATALCGAPTLRAEEALDASIAGLQRYFGAHDYARAERACRQLIAEHPVDADWFYNLACALALEGKPTDAISALAQAETHGYYDAVHTLGDADLATLRSAPGFQAIIGAMQAQGIEVGQPCEPLLDVPGTRVVDATPSNGMHYRLYIPDKATAKDQARLMVWMHPAGGSMDDVVVKTLAPSLAAHGWALMIFPQKQYRGWANWEAGHMEACFQEAWKDPAIDDHRPVPLSFSAGGQIALECWHQEPRYWSGMVLDAAYPIDTATLQYRPLTPGEIACATPVMAIVGSRDGLAPIWKQAEPIWQSAGIPLLVLGVEGRVHEFLYVQQVWSKTLDWLDTLKASQHGKPNLGTTIGATPAAGGTAKDGTARDGAPAAAP